MMGQPQNSPRALEILALLMDEIWYLVGDRSVDSSWYTKRAALAGPPIHTLPPLRARNVPGVLSPLPLSRCFHSLMPVFLFPCPSPVL